ncbi:winged helix-turn-helix transcriptional regulator [Oenococcus sicerae]|uniref:MarR family transcriptional regulator n=1 Tax=Oenococcus sicerae TaxID=2203724 RepID=A0AAJ1VP54_9LACO|nr:MarR family winged helix-turn-helix transcriptional regulator [Oenococcus sicerae]MDN6900904.1 MarR family transcriptional regulator [Oenococcus sicerae]QAS69180.1 winged helix-turn-helix transcriptional regulator [Oenococcus sicerae]
MEKSLGIAIKKANNSIQRYGDQVARQMGLTGVQMSIIDFLYRMETVKEINQSYIENEFNIQKSSATSLLQLMEKKGLVTRLPSSTDSRYKIIRLTSQTEKSAENIHKALQKNDDMLRKLLGENADLVINSLEKVITEVKPK